MEEKVQQNRPARSTVLSIRLMIPYLRPNVSFARTFPVSLTSHHGVAHFLKTRRRSEISSLSSLLLVATIICEITVHHK